MKKIISILTIALMVCTTSMPLYAKSVNELKQQQQEIDKREKDLENSLSSAAIQKNTVFGEIKTLDNNIAAVEDELDKLDKQLIDTEQRLSASEAELVKAQADKDKQYEYLKKRIKFMYENGDVGYLDIFLNFKDFSSLLTRAEYINNIIKYDNEVFENMKLTEETIKIKILEVETEKKGIELLAKEQVSKQHSIEEAREQKYQKMVKLEKDIESYEKKIQEAKDDDAEIERQIKKAAEEAARKAAAEAAAKKAAAEAAAKKAGQSKSNYSEPVVSSKYTGGQMMWPLPGYYSISSEYGYRPSPFSGKTELHRGKDIMAPKGTKVLAAASGTVITSQYLNSYGNAVIIDHGGGINTVYAHNSKLLVSVGDVIKKGQAIAQVGSTGDSTGNHLHFEVRVNGKCTSPDPYVKG